MKTRTLSIILVCTGVTLLSMQSRAADDRFICRATCAIVDLSKSAVVTFLSESGKSEISKDEAFQVTEQYCKNKVRSRGYDENSAILIKGYVHASRSSASQEMSTASARKGWSLNSGAKRTKYTVKSFFSLTALRENESAEWTQKDSSFSYTIEAADLTSCENYQPNPEGNPKYIGPDTPLG